MRVLFVSKPVVPPFHDGSQVLVREIAAGLTQVRARVCGVAGQSDWGRALGLDVVPVYGHPGGFAPALFDNARVLALLLADRRSDVWHFVFAPNRRSCQVARGLKLLRRVPMLQTIASPPRDFADIDELLFGDLVVVQSEWTKRRILAQSQRGANLVLVRPPLGQVPTPSPEAIAAVRDRLGLKPGQRAFVYPGDLEFSRGADRVAAAAERLQASDSVFVFACRKKTSRAEGVEAALRHRLNPERVRFAGELPSLLPLLAAASAVVFPVEELFAKVDIPIALLEAMALGVPLVVADTGPAAELRGPLQVKLGDPDALLAALGRLDTPGVRHAVIEAQKEQVANEFSAKVVAGRYEALYHELCT